MTVTLEQLEEFLRQEPPRRVPANIRRRRVPALELLFGVPFAALFIAIGGFMSIFFFPWKLPSEVLLDLDRGLQAKAVVNHREATSMSVNNAKVQRIEYEFTTESGERFEGACYFTRGVPKLGQQVDVVYLADNPRRSRLVGGRINPFGYGGSFVILFPLVGAGVLGAMAWNRRRQMRILKWGAFAMGTLADIQTTNVSVNNQVRHRIVLQFNTRDLPETVEHYAYGDDVRIAQQHLDQDEPIGVLYDPAKPSRMIFAESLLTM